VEESRYHNEHGLLTMCANCRRTRRSAGIDWDWVPEFLHSPPGRVSHGLCTVCQEYFFGRWLGRNEAPRLRHGPGGGPW
jgi:hypothetical protein